MQLFDPRGRFNEPPRSRKDAEHQRLMREARERKRLADRTPEQVAEDEARAQREWEARILDGLAGEDRHRRQTILLHRRGEYRLTETQRAYERRKKARHRARKRQQRQAAEAALAAEARIEFTQGAVSRISEAERLKAHLSSVSPAFARALAEARGDAAPPVA